MDYSSLICLSALWHCAYRQECLLVYAPVQRLCKIDKVPAFFVVNCWNWNLSAQNNCLKWLVSNYYHTLVFFVVIMEL